MGSGVSTPPPSDQEWRANAPAQSADMDDQKTHLVRTNQVAPIIIKNCREEFQHVSEINEPIVYGQIAENMPEHPLIKGMYFLVKDVSADIDKLNTLQKKLIPNFRRCKGSYPVYGMGQPTRDGLHHLVHNLSSEKHTYIFLISLRQEPVLFAQVGYDLLPYSPRHQDTLSECVFRSASNPFDPSQYECDLRKEIIELAHFKDDQKFYLYNDIEKFQDDPHMYRIAYEDDMAVTEEVYSRLSFNSNQIKHVRLCLPPQGAPSEDDIDKFVGLFRALTDWHDKSAKVPCCVFTSHTGESRATFGMVMGCLMLAHKSGFPAEASKTPYAINERAPNYERGEFYIIRQLIKLIPGGTRVKHEVDTIIDQCDELYNVRKVVADAKSDLDSIKEDFVIEGLSAKTHCLQKCLKALERYFYLICFNAYLHSETGKQLSESFGEWMHNNSELYYLLNTMNATERSASSELLADGVRALVADEYIGLDLLSSQMDVKTSNFRRVPGLPVYGMSQPSREGLSSVVNHLLHQKQGHPSVVWINLREEVTVECNGATYTAREPGYLDEPILIPGVTASEIESREEDMKETIKRMKTLQVHEEANKAAEQKDFNSVLTCRDMVDQLKMQTADLQYSRIPMPDDVAPPEKFFDDIVSVMKTLKTIDEDEDGPALVFQCRSGKGRTTTAMAIAGLVIFHKKGFPYGTKPGEEERVSLPNAKYTQGHYKIVQQVVRKLPFGQQVKREVDFVLNQCSDTMTPMHYHIRELIFVTYNKIKKGKTDQEQLFWRKRSLDYLERYIYLILFNAYLHSERRDKWRTTFSKWMKEVASKAGMYEILDDLNFVDFDERTEPLRKKCRRSMVPFSKKLPIRGSIV